MVASFIRGYSNWHASSIIPFIREVLGNCCPYYVHGLGLLCYFKIHTGINDLKIKLLEFKKLRVILLFPHKTNINVKNMYVLKMYSINIIEY